MGRVGKEHPADCLDKGVVILPIPDHNMDQVSYTRAATQNSNPDLYVTRRLLGVITNQIKDSPCLPRKWKKLTREVGQKTKKGKAGNGKCRMSIDCEGQSGGKKPCLYFGSLNKNNNLEVAARVQHYYEQ